MIPPQSLAGWRTSLVMGLGPADVPPHQKRLLSLLSSSVTKRSSPLERSEAEDGYDFAPLTREGPCLRVPGRPGWVPSGPTA